MACIGASTGDIAARVLAGLGIAIFLSLTLYFLATHEMVAALPSIVPDEQVGIAARVGAAQALRDTVNLLITISAGLSAVVGFSLRDGLGPSIWPKAINLILISGFAYFLTREFVFAYNIFGAIALQLDRGFLLISRLEEMIFFQANAVLFCAALTMALLIWNLIVK
jgi:hypothetical protein